ncbi:MAG: sigma-70 family RNA polymerase sigma factor [Ruminococcaceae bacterium]|nr:sigma-70 family RNA polymerase sigma factor [Oscillospiraceae bacterium]
MEDKEIVALFWKRDENAVEETAKKYGNYCYSIAYQILENHEDSEESVNDTYIDAWNSIPPHKPSVLSAFLGKITRRIAIDRWRNRRAEKRGGGEPLLVLDELRECIATDSDVETNLERKVLVQTVNAFLGTLSATERKMFVCRYFYMDSVESVCKQFGFSESKVKSMLFRTREKLRIYLQKEGF